MQMKGLSQPDLMYHTALFLPLLAVVVIVIYRRRTLLPIKQSPAESGQVSDIWIYPIKSCRGIQIQQADIIKTGLNHDRQYTFATRRLGSLDPLWYCATQRQYPRLALVQIDILNDYKGRECIKSTFEENHTESSFKILEKKGEFELPLEDCDIEASDVNFPIEQVYIWKETPEALNVTHFIKHVLTDLRKFLKIPDSQEFGLFRIPPGRPREVYRNAPRAETIGYQPLVGFADSYPIHLMSLSSYEDLRAKLKDDSLRLTLSRFRANVIVTGLPPFDEDDWKYVRIGYTDYHVATRAVRCTLPNVDQDTGERHKSEPDRSMNTYRRIDAGAPSHACFGIHLVPASITSSIRLGDKLQVIRRGEHCYLPL